MSVGAAGRLLAASWLALLVWQITWHAVLPAPLGNRNAWLAALTALPLLLLTRGVIGNRGNARFWSMFVLMLYLVVGIVETWANPDQRYPAAVQVVLCVACFFGLVRVSRR
jgi:uncharacterized membrane protein